MSEFETIQDIVLAAYRNMSSDVWDFVCGGTESETTLLRNRQALDTLAFRPRVLRDVSKIDTSTTLLGSRLPIPVFLAPVGGLNQIDPDGAGLALRAASRFGVLKFLSSVNGCLELEEGTEIVGDSLVFQLYIRGDEAWLDAFLDRIEKANCRGLCLTVDIAVYSRRERDLFNRYRPPGREDGERDGFRYQSAMTWDFIDKVRRRLDIPLILKGIATAEDAKLAVEHGVDIVYVSNHGGRQLDHGRGCIDVLPEVIEAVSGRADVVIDSGFVRGTDILKAIALGARAVGLGKLQVWALAAGGEEGLVRMLEILKDEILTSMGLLGVTKLEELSSSYLHPAEPTRSPGEFSPFPSIEKLLSVREPPLDPK
ncbi:MAG: alpha-hydroxy-acid oxidizing protein [Desulfobacterales bacterium]|nr:alpha-hydroxy-acid oxidizing protein [Desulfobacterales bacterium]